MRHPHTRRKYFIHLVLLLFLSLFALQAVAKDNQADLVAFNVQTHKVHKLSRTWAKKCTKKCITIPRSDAYKRGGVACKVCGG
jgi:hypothetical protein